MTGVLTLDMPYGLAPEINASSSSNLRNIQNQGSSSLILESANFASCDLDDAAIYGIVDAMVDPNDLSNPYASATVTHTGNPSSGTLSAPTIALAASKNITLNPVA